MSNWKNEVIDLGEIIEGGTYNIEFISLKDLNVKSVTAGCGCTIPKWNKEKKTVTARYSPGVVPHHLRKSGSMESTKYITVELADGTKEKLTFKSKIVVK